jgi:hypothetical protein
VSVKIAERLQRVRSYGERLIPLGPGVVWFSNPDLGTGLCFPITKLGYRIRLSGPTGAVEAFLTYINPTTQPQQAYFLFPLDRDITPVKVRVKHGQFQMETEVCPSPQDSAAESVREPIPAPLARLFQSETEKVLALHLGTVEPGEEVSLQILYACFVSECGEEGRGFSFRLPLMASRALTTLNPDDAEQTALASGLERNPSVAISILVEASDLQPGRISSSQVCGMARQPNGDIAIEFDRSKPLEARDFVLDYQLWAGPRPKAWLRSQGRHFLLNFLPPAIETPTLPRRLVFLVDGSDEMNRVGKARCHDCIAGVLQGLAPNDSFALVTFNRDVAGFKSGDFVETRYVNEALTWLKDYTFGGVADLKALLERVVKLPRQTDSVLSIILVTAGRLGNEPELYRLLQGSRENLRFFPVILGRKADPHFARAASKATGGRAFRALSEESISRVSERLLEETRQPVLEIIGIQDRGLGFQGDSLTPKYPSGLSGFRPINILGVHTGRGGVEAGGKSGQGVSWSEQVEPKEVFHKVLPVVWAQVKAGELDDEARMLDRAERGILRNVVRSLSEDYFLSNNHTAVLVRDNMSAEPRFAPYFEPWRWYKVLEKLDENAKSANELLEEQKAQKGIKGGRMAGVARGGLKMKDTMGKGASATVFGSKLGHQSRLAGNVKDGLFSKPMLGSAAPGGPPKAFSVGAAAGGSGPGGTAVISRGGPAPGPATGGPGPREPMLTSASATPQPPPVTSPPALPDAAAPPPRPAISPPGPSSGEASAAPNGGEGPRLIRPVSLRPQGPSSFGTEPISKPGGPTPPTTPEPAAPPVRAASVLPTPRDLAAMVSAEARTGVPEERAKNALRKDPEARQALMNQMRQLHGALGTSSDLARLTELTDVVLLQLARVAPESELLVRAYGMGYQGRGLLAENIDDAKEKLKFWLSRFAKLF